MEGPRLFFATVLRDPLSEVTRKERVYLLGTSVVGIAILKTGLIPTKITALGIELERADREAFLALLGWVVFYFLAAFIVYAFSDFLAWWEEYRLALAEIDFGAKDTELLREERRRVEGRSDDYSEARIQRLREERQRAAESVRRLGRTWRTGVLVATIRALLEYLLPVLVGAYAAYILIL